MGEPTLLAAGTLDREFIKESNTNVNTIFVFDVRGKYTYLDFYSFRKYSSM